jgi:ABC-2 type transport system permease protein
VRNVWLLAHKDIREAFGRRMILLRLLIPAVLLPIFYGFFAGAMIRDAARNAQGAGALIAQVPLFAAIVVLLGSLIAVMVTADAIAGEKERRTIETLLATPISDQEIFAGKLLAGVIPAILIGYGGGLIFFVTARLVSGAAPIPVAPLLATVRIILAGVPVVAALLAALGVIISSRCGTVTTATQLSTFASMPIFGLVVYLGVRMSRWSLPELLTLLIGLLAALVLLLRLGARALDREEIVARLD